VPNTISLKDNLVLLPYLILPECWFETLDTTKLSPGTITLDRR